MSLTPAIAVEHISFGYRDREDVLQDISFAIAPGSYVGLLGPNGGGKTTLVKIILGQLQPTQGTVRIFGLTPVHAAQHRLMGYVQQRVLSQEVLLPITVEELLLNAALIGGMSFFSDTKAAKHRVRSVLRQLSIERLATRLVSSLSGGERQRAFIARALIHQPRLLILDEPTTGVDPKSRDEFHEILRTIHHSGVTLLYVSHDTDVIAANATDVLCLNRTLLGHCEPSDLSSPERLEKLYGGLEKPLHHHHHHA